MSRPPKVHKAPQRCRVRWSPKAIADLESIGDFIALDSPAAAERWTIKLAERVTLAATMPKAGRIVPELRRADIREVFLRTYRIIYRLAADELHILTIFEGHRLFPEDVNASGK